MADIQEIEGDEGRPSIPSQLQPYRQLTCCSPSRPVLLPTLSLLPTLHVSLHFAFNSQSFIPPQPSLSSLPSNPPATHTPLLPPSTLAAKSYVGVNSAGVAYWTPEQPFLNVFKAASTNVGGGSGNPFTPLASWCTMQDATHYDTGESAYLQLDADGYPTSLLANPTPPGGQRFVAVSAWMQFNEPYLAPGAPSYYPAGNYTLMLQGEGTVVMGGGVAGFNSDIAVTGWTASTGIRVVTSGQTTGTLTIVSSQPAGTLGRVTFNVPTPSRNGLTLQITALPSATNYIRDITLVQTAYLDPFTYEGRAYPGYLAGQLFHPTFLSAFRIFSRFRCMDWQATNSQDWGVAFTADLAKGATSGVIRTTASVGGFGAVSSVYAWWPLPSGVYRWVFATGQVVDVNCTMREAAVTWSTPLSAAVTTKATPTGEMAFHPMQPSFSSRPLLSNAHWSTARGVPLEACMTLATEMDVDVWLCLPATSNTVSGGDWARQVARLAFDGTGSVVKGSLLKEFKGVAAEHRCVVSSLTHNHAQAPFTSHASGSHLVPMRCVLSDAAS